MVNQSQLILYMRLLLIEPDQNESSFLKRSLSAASFSVDTANTGQDGSYLARTNDYDLIVCEFLLPDRSGIEVCRELRLKRKHTPFIILSSLSEMITKVECLNGGADDYVTKPFYFEEILARIRAILRRPQLVAHTTIKIADLELDSVRHMVKRAGRTVYLTRKEFELLEHLMRNQGIVLSRGHIMEHVWDIHADIFSNTIETHILNLRRKVDYIPYQKLIHTIPGRGYKLEVVENEKPRKQKTPVKRLLKQNIVL
jgi:two-component system, OmpR family, response regulator